VACWLDKSGNQVTGIGLSYSEVYNLAIDRSAWPAMIIFIHQNGRNTKRKRKNTLITKITLTISNGEHIKQTLSTNKPYRH